MWTVLSGQIEIRSDGSTIDVTAGDTIVMPPEVERQVSAREDACIVVCGFADAVASVVGDETPHGTPGWIA